MYYQDLRNIFTRPSKKCTKYNEKTHNEKYQISTNLNTVSMMLLHLGIIVWHILCIGATINCYLSLLPL